MDSLYHGLLKQLFPSIIFAAILRLAQVVQFGVSINDWTLNVTQSNHP